MLAGRGLHFHFLPEEGEVARVIAKHVAKETPEATTTRRDLEALEANEPERETEDMFGDKAVNPEWSEWRARLYPRPRADRVDPKLNQNDAQRPRGG